MSVKVQKLSCDLYELFGESSEFIDHANAFLKAQHTRNLTACTIRAYAFDLLVLYRWMSTTGKRLEQLEESTLLDFIRFQKEQNASPRSINRRLNTAYALYLFITGKRMRRGIGAVVPAPYYRGAGKDRYLGLHQREGNQRRPLSVKVPQTLIKPLVPPQVKMFLRSCKRFRDLAIVYLMLLCGLRSREVLALEINDLCFESTDKPSIRVRGKGNKQRLVPMAITLIQTVTSYLKFERPKKCGTQRLFVVLQGPNRKQAMTVAGLRNLFRQRQLNPKLHNANPHRFRHTFALDLARAGTPLPILQKLMGHTDWKITMNYINLSLSDIATEYERAMQVIAKQYQK